ncbi:MAG: 16S rRNA processing protein RimM [Chitinophagaceae bacterium]|jgi:16S rRNA processing protein RimM|nr:16S rRNA processing protein RimM [Chitinophagaceae bacterium]
MVAPSISVGRLAGAFGLKGDFVLVHSLGKKTALAGLKVVFVEITKGAPIPYFLQSAKAKSNTETLIKLEGVDTREAALKLLQKNVWLTEVDFQQHVSAGAPLGLLGYTLMQGKKELGTIAEIIEQPHQVIATLFINNKEVLVPLNEATLKQINRKKKVVEVELPDGLLEVYLN